MKAGDKVRIIGEDPIWHTPVGTIVELLDPPLVNDYLKGNPILIPDGTWLRYRQPETGTGTSSPIGSWIPLASVELIEEQAEEKRCTCDLMATGCICGAFERERAR